MKRKVTLGILFAVGLTIGLVRFYPRRAPHESTPPGLRELMLASISNGMLDLTHMRLVTDWDRLCLLPSGTSDEVAHRNLPFLYSGWHLPDNSDVATAPVTAVLLFGLGGVPVGVADIPVERVRFYIATGACRSRTAARFPAN
jgi:hypothetical protein